MEKIPISDAANTLQVHACWLDAMTRSGELDSVDIGGEIHVDAQKIAKWDALQTKAPSLTHLQNLTNSIIN